MLASFVMLLGVAWIFGSVLPCFGTGGFHIRAWVLLLPAFFVAAKGWYFFCSFIDWLIRPRNPKVLGRWMLRAGLICWLLFFFLPVIVTATAALLNLPCTARPDRHTLPA